MKRRKDDRHSRCQYVTYNDGDLYLDVKKLVDVDSAADRQPTTTSNNDVKKLVDVDSAAQSKPATTSNNRKVAPEPRF